MKCGKRLKTLLAEAFLRKPPPPQQEDSPKSSFFSPSEEEAKGLAKGLVVVVTWFFFGWVYALMWILGFGAKDAWRGRAKARLKPRAQVSGRFLLFLVLGLMSLSLLGIASVYLSGGPHLSVPERLASPGFRFSVGDALVNVNNGVEIGVVVRTERAHSFRNGMVDRAYIIAGPNGVEMDMVADVLERIAAPTPRVLPGPVAAAPPGPSAGTWTVWQVTSIWEEGSSAANPTRKYQFKVEENLDRMDCERARQKRIDGAKERARGFRERTSADGVTYTFGPTTTSDRFLCLPVGKIPPGG